MVAGMTTGLELVWCSLRSTLFFDEKSEFEVEVRRWQHEVADSVAAAVEPVAVGPRGVDADDDSSEVDAANCVSRN